MVATVGVKMSAVIILLGLIGILHGYVAWRFWLAFGRRRHPMQIIAALEPLGWVVAVGYAIEPTAPARILTLSAALSVGCFAAFTAWLAGHNRRLKTKWDARAKALGGER